MNFGEAKTKAIKLINEYSNKGAINPAAKIADYTLRFPDVAQAAQTEIATVKKIHAVYNFSQKPINPLGGLFSGFDEVQFLGTDIKNTSGVGAKSYYFEVDRQCTVYIEEETSTNVWTTLKTVSVPSSVTSYTAYKGNVTPSNVSHTVRIRFTGSYPFNIRNQALWAYTFATENDVPDYRPYVKYSLPSNAMEIKKIIQETPVRKYNILTNFYQEGKTTVVVNYYLTGSFRVEYFQYPTEVTSDTADDFEFELDYEAQELIPYYMAASVLLDDKETRPHGVMLMNIYQGKLANMSSSDNTTVNQVQNYMSW